jgi:DNA-binding LytR/AlgR family response regulator
MGKIYILDDNFAQRKIVQTACTELFKELQIFYELITVESIAKFYKELENLSIYSCDVFFIEINLNHYYNGINFAKKIKKRSFNTNIIFFTRNRQASIEIINHNIYPIAYILKNDSLNYNLYNDLKIVFQKILAKDSELNCSVKKIQLKTGANIYYFDVAEINYIETDAMNRQTLNVHLINQKYIKIKKKIKHLKNELQFFQDMIAFKSMIINKRNIKVINRQEEFLQFRDDTHIFIGKKIIDRIKKEN